MARECIVIVEDDAPIRRGVRDALTAAGYDAIEAADGEAGLTAARRPGVALVLLDLMLPKLDGLAVLKTLRKTHGTLPVIVLTARGSEDERVAGLRAGADDYVVKPFSARELVARVEAVLRRSPERPGEVREIGLGPAVIDLDRREVRCPDGSRQDLSETEGGILSYLAMNLGRAVAREELLTRLWGLGGGKTETRTVDMHVARLRAKLSAMIGEAGETAIQTVRGKGYMLGAAMSVKGRERTAESGGGPGDGGSC